MFFYTLKRWLTKPRATIMRLRYRNTDQVPWTILESFNYSSAIRQAIKASKTEDILHSHELSSDNMVIHVGATTGDWAQQIQEKYNCQVQVYPMTVGWTWKLQNRFADSTCVYAHPNNLKMNHVRELLEEVEPREIDLLRIGSFGWKSGAEGGEYTLLPMLIDSGLHKRCRQIMIQYNENWFMSHFRRYRINRALNHTHKRVLNYPFVFEKWVRRDVLSGT